MSDAIDTAAIRRRHVWSEGFTAISGAERDALCDEVDRLRALLADAAPVIEAAGRYREAAGALRACSAHPAPLVLVADREAARGALLAAARGDHT